ncbi:MAG TPA: PaaI family thioesterase [Candidatus Thermoplasmatota archaeon]|nr:PaaI family thioesterase [Candidatus Thermoplasmatota archaeon]
MTDQAAQDRYAPHGICFGCGPANPKGLRIKSRWEGDDFVARFAPLPEHQAFPGVLSGGILGTLLDCHSNWCGSMTLLRERGLAEAPTTVTAEFHVKLKRPTPFPMELKVVARPTKVEGDTVWVRAEVVAGEKVTATCDGVFVAVKPGHPAYHRWG